MAVLVWIFTFLLLLCTPAWADPNPVEVIFDPGNPDTSVGVVGHEVVETGSLYENFQVIGFEQAAVIVRENETYDDFKWYREGEVPAPLHERARRLFVAKQMKAIFEAQNQFLEKFHDHYASDLTQLIDQGFLPNGFDEMRKENYLFRILKSGEAKKLAIQQRREPTFIAVAEPLDPEKDRTFFSVDQLGQVRYADSLRTVTWGPVWDYGGMNEPLPSTVITYSKDGGEE